MRSRLLALWWQVVGDIRGRALGVILGCLLCQMGLGFGYVLNPLAGEIIEDMGWSRAEYSAARLPQLLLMSLSSPLVGALTLRFGSRLLLMVSAVLLSSCFFLLSFIDSLWQYYLIFLVLGVGLTGVGDITVGQVVAQWVSKSRGLALGIVYIGSNLGALLLIPIALAVADESSWRQAALVLAGCGLGVLLPAAAFLVRQPQHPAGTPEDAGGFGERAAAADRLRDLDTREALRTRTFWLLAFSLVAFFFYFLAMIEHLVLFLTDDGMPRTQAAYAYAAAIGLGIWSKLGLGLLADRIPEKASLLVDYALLATSSVVLLALPSDSLLWIFVASYGISVAARDVVYPLIVARCFGVSNMAGIYGVLMLGLVIGGGLGPLFAAWVHDSTGSYDLAFRTFAAVNVLSVIGLCFVRDERARWGEAREGALA